MAGNCLSLSLQPSSGRIRGAVVFPINHVLFRDLTWQDAFLGSCNLIIGFLMEINTSWHKILCLSFSLIMYTSGSLNKLFSYFHEKALIIRRVLKQPNQTHKNEAAS